MNQASAEFYNRCRAFLRANQGMAAVVHANPEQADMARELRIRDEWFTYLHEKGLTSTLATWQFILKGGGKAITVPCDSPELFDPSYVAPRHMWREPKPADQPRTRDIAAVLARTKAELAASKPRGRANVPTRPSEPVKPPQDWLDEYQANPPPIPVFSEQFKASMRTGAA